MLRLLHDPFWQAMVIFSACAVLGALLWAAHRAIRRRSAAMTNGLEPDLRTALLARLEGHIQQSFSDSLPHHLKRRLQVESLPPLMVRSDMVDFSISLDDIQTGKTMLEQFDAADHQLLILGTPGAGKTTLLSGLAHALVQRAQHDPHQRIPVLVSLSSWSPDPQPFEGWLLNRLMIEYGLSDTRAIELIEGNHLILLLDGLDEVAPEQRPACLAAINMLRSYDDIVLEFALSSREQPYTALQQDQQQRAFRHAVTIQPLTLAQIDAVLTQNDQHLAGLYVAWQHDIALHELLTIPLVLNMALLTYTGQSAASFTASSAAERQQQLCAAYVQRMLTHHPHILQPYTTTQATRWLTWLAMSMRYDANFMPEYMQPALLSTLPLRLLYRMLNGLYLGVPVALLYGMQAGVQSGIIAGLIFGPGLGLIGVLQAEIDVHDTPNWSWHKSRQHWHTGVLSGVTSGVILGITAGIVGGLAAGLIVGLIDGLIVGVFAWLIRGINEEHFDRQTVPNQAIQRARYGFWQGIVGGIVLSILLGILLGSIQIAGLAPVWDLTPGEGVLFLLAFGLLGGWAFGGDVVSKHYILRFLLAMEGSLPLNCLHFLNTMHRLLLVQRIDGMYRFRHRLLQDYFASLAHTPHGRTRRNGGKRQAEQRDEALLR